MKSTQGLVDKRQMLCTPLQGTSEYGASMASSGILGKVLWAYFLTMFLLAFAMPERHQDVPGFPLFIEISREWFPNVKLIAARAVQPMLVEGYLVAAMVLWLPFFIAYVGLRPRGKLMIPLNSWPVKILPVVAFGLMLIVASAFWWNPAVAPTEIGLHDSRAGAFLAVALSGRLGMALALNLLFGLAPLMLAMLIWTFLTLPVKRRYQEM